MAQSDDDLQLKSYQDDLDDNDTPDPFMREEGEDPTEDLGVSPDEFKQELDKEAVDDEGVWGKNPYDDDLDDADLRDDEREYIEDLDEDTDDDRGY